eukprot:COSAG06_NODE_3576_length_5164_cov_2.017173_2_plen_580_part_00
MNFDVTGGVLNLQGLRLVASSLQASAVGQITVETCTGSLSDITVADSSLEITGAPEGLEISGAVQLNTASNLQDVRINGVTFSRASLNVQSTSVRMDGCGGILNGVTTQDSSINIDDSPMELSGSLSFVRSGVIEFTGKAFNADVTVQATPAIASDPRWFCPETSGNSYLSRCTSCIAAPQCCDYATASDDYNGGKRCNGILSPSTGTVTATSCSGIAQPDVCAQAYVPTPADQPSVIRLIGCSGSLSSLSLSGASLLTDSSSLTMSGSVQMDGAEFVVFDYVAFNGASLTFRDGTNVNMTSCSGSISGLTVGDSSMSVAPSSSISASGAFAISGSTISLYQIDLSSVSIIVYDGSDVTMTACSGTVSHFHASTSHVGMIGFVGTVSDMKVDGRQDTGPMGSCDGSIATYCSQFASGYTGNGASAYSFPAGCSTTSPTCDGPQGSCCSSSGSAALCLSSWSTFSPGNDGTDGCRNLPLGATFTEDNTTATNTAYSCGSRYRGSRCDIVPKTCRSQYSVRNAGNGGRTILGVQSTNDCGGSGSNYQGCDATRSCSCYCNPTSHTFVARNRAECVNSDVSC